MSSLLGWLLFGLLRSWLVRSFVFSFEPHLLNERTASINRYFWCWSAFHFHKWRPSKIKMTQRNPLDNSLYATHNSEPYSFQCHYGCVYFPLLVCRRAIPSAPVDFALQNAATIFLLNGTNGKRLSIIHLFPFFSTNKKQSAASIVRYRPGCERLPLYFFFRCSDKKRNGESINQTEGGPGRSREYNGTQEHHLLTSSEALSSDTDELVIYVTVWYRRVTRKMLDVCVGKLFFFRNRHVFGAR